MAVVFATFGGPSGGLASGGRSAIWTERGALVAELDATGSGVVVAIEGPDGWQGRTVALASV
jgi:NAD+ synthase (glutamine-hydrolysing)